MSKSDAFENAWMLLVFQNTNIANIGDATGLRGSTTVGSLYVALHTADPGETGTQTTNEVTTGAYTGYARVAVARTTGGWTVTNNSVSPTANIDFPACTGGTGATATYWSVGTLSTGAGTILYSGTITPNIAISNGVTPRITTASTITED